MKYTLLFLLLLVPTLHGVDEEQSSDGSDAFLAGTLTLASLSLGSLSLGGAIESCPAAATTPDLTFCGLSAAGAVLSVSGCLCNAPAFVYFLIKWCQNRSSTTRSSV